MNGASPETFTVRLLTANGITAGLGALIGDRHIVTCAHVVNTALGAKQGSQARPTGTVRIDFPYLDEGGTEPAEAAIVAWRPPPRPGVNGDDVAGLELRGDPPPGASAGRLAADPPRPGVTVTVLGYPEPKWPRGVRASATIGETVPGGRVQLESEPGSATRILPGFSGSPVIDEGIGRIVGIVAEAEPRSAADETSGLKRSSNAIGSERLRAAWPEAFGAPQAAGTPRPRERLTVLCLRGPELTGDDVPEALLEPLHRDIAELDAAPDLLIVTGNLAAGGRPDEYARVVEVLGRLAGAAGISRRNVAIVPGRSDVNRPRCAGYFLIQEGDGQEPVPPYFPKWDPYQKAFEAFYAGVDGVSFTPDEPWTLFTMPDLGVVVAGLNSTMRESHLEEDPAGDLGEKQSTWFERRLEEYRGRRWVRLAAVHHGWDGLREAGQLDAPGLVSLRFSSAPGGSGGYRYNLVTIERERAVHRSRRYADGRWGPATSGQPTVRAHRLADVDTVFPAPRAEPSRDREQEQERPDGYPARRFTDPYREFVGTVETATRIRFPDATVDARPDDGYLRISRPADGGTVELSVVGVVDGDITAEAVDAYADGVHARFYTADPTVRSELVYGGPVAPQALSTRARRRGIALRSFVEYQGLLDLRPLTDKQRDRLAGDTVYPAALYVEQRFLIDRGRTDGEVITGLIAQATDWLASSDARLIVVLGDFGRGKTSFLRQLTRRLPDELPTVIPVLVELRTLEKGPSLDDLLAQHLVRQGVEDFSQDKLRYMIASGRVALLFDGFDELELRVGYDSAADYLQSLLNSATGQAKVILTSRTQHFRSTRQVREALDQRAWSRTELGQRVENRPGSRMVILQDFADDQIRDFLTGLYGDEERARHRYDLIASVPNLHALTRNPRMLSFVAQFDDDRLREVRAEDGQISPALLYEEIIGYWLSNEEERQRHRRGLASLTQDERFKVCTKLALRLWKSGAPAISLRDLTAAVADTLTRLAERGFSDDQAAHSIASGSLLVRTDEDTFSFVHQSIMEWLVAAHAARELNDQGSPEVLSHRQLSRLMASFFRDLAGREHTGDWAAGILAADDAPDLAKRNAVALLDDAAPPPTAAGAPARPSRQNLSGMDLRGQDLNGRDLRGANLRGANLAGMRLAGVDLSGADLTEANLTGVVMTGGSLHGTTLTGSTWYRATLLDVSGLPDPAAAPELTTAAILGPDQPEVILNSAGICYDVAFSPDGALLAIACGSIVQIADASTGTTLRVLRGHGNTVTAVVFSPDSTHIATASNDGTARIWDTATGTHRTTLTGHKHWVTAVAYSPDSTHIATASNDRTARIWDTATGTHRTTLTGHTRAITAVAFSPRSTHIATASEDGTARIWNPATGTTRTTLTGHTRKVTAVAFSPRSTHIATASYDGTARIWDTATGTTRTTLTGHTSWVNAVAFSPDNTHIATASYDGTARIWNPATGTTRTTLTGHDGLVTAVAYSPDSTHIVTASADRTARIWDTATGTCHTTLTGHTRAITAVAFSPRSTHIATASNDGTARIWDTATGTTHTTLRGHTRAITAVAFSPHSTHIATASEDHTARIWNPATGTTHTTLTGHTSWVTGIAYSPDGTHIATASEDHTARIWDTTTGTTRTTLTGHTGRITGIAYSPDNTHIATASADRTARIWNPATGTTHTTLRGHTSWVTAVAYSPDSTHIATASEDHTARIWNLSTTRTRGRFQRRSTAPEPLVLRGHSGSVRDIRFSPDGRTVATVSSDGTVRLWSVTDGAELGSLQGHGDTVSSVVFSPDGSFLAGAGQWAITFWNLATGEVAATLAPLEDDGYAVLMPDGSYKLAGNPGDAFWWAMKLCRFGPGELDPYVPEIRRLPDDAPLLPRRGR